MSTKTFSIAGDDISDGYHTFGELYQHRHMLFAAFCKYHWRATAKVWKSRLHNDGSAIEGWFIAGIDLPVGTITYHLPEDHWDIIDGDVLDRAPEWDGYTSQDTVKRLAQWIMAD